MKHNPKNERIKRQYFVFLEQAKRQSVASVDAVAMAISRFEIYTRYKGFNAFHFEQAVGFKKHLARQNNQQTGQPLSKATLNSTLRHLKAFFQWLSQQAGYKSRLNYTDMEYFNLSEKEVRIATAKRIRPVPTIEQINHVLKTMPTKTVVQRRDRALIAFTLLSGARDSAIASMRLRHIDLSSDCVHQDAREVKTKNSKTITSYFFPVGDEIRQIVTAWLDELKNEHLFGLDDPLFPKTAIQLNKQHSFEASGIKKEPWATANPIRVIFKQAFTSAGLDYFNPHSFRNTLATLGEQICQTPEEFKAWSQNLGHNQVLTTFLSYGEVQPQKQSEIFQKLKEPKTENEASSDEALARVIVKAMKDNALIG